MPVVDARVIRFPVERRREAQRLERLAKLQQLRVPPIDGLEHIGGSLVEVVVVAGVTISGATCSLGGVNVTYGEPA